MSANEISVPVIDLTNFPSERNKLAAACTTLGCFRVVNHGVPAALKAEVKTVFRYLFEMSDEMKLRNADIILGSGYVKPSSKNPLYEGFGIFNAAFSSDVSAFCSVLEVTPLHREIICSYASKLHALIVEIASKVADSLGLVGYSFEDWLCQFRINKYNFTSETIGSLGVQVHTDSGFLTVLQEDESVGGLEIMDSTGNFVAIEPVPGTFLVNLGDTAKMWSNGRLHNIKHRVQCNEAVPRISIALFMLAPKDDMLEPQQELIDSEHPRLYQAVSFEEFRKLWFSSEGKAGEILSLLAADQTTVKA